MPRPILERSTTFCLLCAVLFLLFLVISLPAMAEIQAPEEKEKHPLESLEWRNIGPVNMSGRVSDVEGVAGRPNVVYVGAAAGGVWKSTDGGLTFDPVFDDQPIASIGDLGVAPSNPEVIYAGSGEANTRNSVSFGNGVYKTTDGGKSWAHVGLEDTRHISRVLVHPENPDLVYAGAVGHIYGPNQERGVFRSKDGGASWEKVLYLDERHGIADLDMAAKNPNVLFAALWHFERKPWTFTSGSEEGGIFRSVDGGDTWKKLTEGLPELMGRTAVKVAPSNPDVVYVMAESNDGVLFRSEDGGDSFKKVSEQVEIVSRGFYYTDLRVDPQDENRVYAVASRLYRSIDGGKTFERISRSTHVDYHSLWIDPTDPNRLWQGQDGGVAVSYDRGDTWEPIRNLPLGQFYQIFHDDRRPFYVIGGGLQDNGTWYGPSRTREPAGILADDWRMMSFGDAYFVVPHPEQEDVFISESQAGGILRTDVRSRQQVDISPQPWRNDGGPVEVLEYRFNWNSPIIASPHDPNVVYFAGNVVFKTTDFGTTWEKISPDLTTDDPEKQGVAGGPVWFENTTAEYHCTIISFAESPVEAGVLWAGTDDGNLQISRDGGANWQNVIENVPGVPDLSPVSHVEPSRTAAGTAYLSFDRHMFDDYRPHVFKTTDFGNSWKRLDTSGLDDHAFVWVLREDPRNHDLVYAGTELGLYASWDAGASWSRLHLGNLPVVPVHDVLIQPRENDLLLGTHGRAIYVFDDAAAIQDWSAEVAEAPAHLFSVRPALRFATRFTRYGMGDKKHVAPNPPYGALLTFRVAGQQEDKDEKAKDGADAEKKGKKGKKKDERVKIEILDAAGEVIRTLKRVPQEPGLHRVAWNLRHDPPRPRRERDDEGGGGDFFRPLGGPEVMPGTYTARLTVKGEGEGAEPTVLETPIEVGVDPLIEVSREELAAQHRVALRIRALQTAANDVLRGLDLTHAQLASRRETVRGLEKELPEELETRWKELDEKLEEFQATVVRPEDKPRWAEGPALSGRLGRFVRSVDTALSAPTPAQVEYFGELEEEAREVVSAWNGILSGELSTLSDALAGEGIPALALPGEVELE